MATRGWQDFTAGDAARHNARTSRKAAGEAVGTRSTPSKYRNVKVVVNGVTFDSKREAVQWVALKACEDAGEIQGLERQVPFPLYAPDERHGVTAKVQIAAYVADFVYHKGFERHVVDAKGHRTALYKLKKKWLELQDGIVIEEV